MRPNLLYVFADQWRANAMGWMCQDQVRTPNMDAFMRESMCCTNAYSTFPLCSPHRASLITGKYPLKVGMWTNCKIGLEEILMLKPQETCIGNVLKEYDYQTGYIGKWHLDASEMNFSDNPKSGAEHWDAYTPPGERRQGFDDWLSYGANDKHMNPHYWKDDETKIMPGKWSVEFETDMAMEYMTRYQEKEQPFALYISYNPPHLPYEMVPDKYYDEYRNMEIHYRDNVPMELREKGGLLETQTRQYFAAVTGVDDQFGRILRFLKEKGLEENTIVVLSADHGDMMGSQGLMSKNVWYEESIHIPLMIRQKGRIQPGIYEEIFASIDHMPTLLELLDIPVPEVVDGFSHCAGILGKPFEKQPPQEMFLCSYPGGAEMVAAFAERGLTHKAYGWRGIRDKRYTYVISNGYEPDGEQEELLYDHETDPFELSPERIPVDCEDEKILGYRKRLQAYLKPMKDPFLMKERAPKESR